MGENGHEVARINFVTSHFAEQAENSSLIGLTLKYVSAV
jgi:hypothetical protein